MYIALKLSSSYLSALTTAAFYELRTEKCLLTEKTGKITVRR
jgi:hypothetical protein